ncbi:hypothetical protein RchiOBHm_Chr5g0005091 [Rosa chinensis]|uniref:Uncharacterized protein n=1 Tax=Rosa chinensis TaxID=74649 RepID=A0A2P6Q361_ROSCH|nr:hypothetical protein RchiOBHm_Chr5g0005091 [Rosa chinensis]
MKGEFTVTTVHRGEEKTILPLLFFVITSLPFAKQSQSHTLLARTISWLCNHI